jgi:hypothetical protein
MITIPSNLKWTQPNNSDILGDLWASFNLDTSSNEGRLRLGRRMILNTGTPDVSEITGVPINFINNTFAAFTFAGASNVGYAFKNDATMIGTFVKDVSSGAPATIDSTKSDAVLSGVNIYVSAKASASGTVSLYKKPPSSGWSEITTTEDNSLSSYTNMLCSYATRLYMSNQYSKIISFDSADSPSYSGTYTVSVGLGAGDPRNCITQLLPADDRIFILCFNLYGGQGHVYEWDGSATSVNYDHRLESAGALAGLMFEGTPYIVDVNGCLLVWNGGTFTEVACLNRENNIPLVYSTAFSALNTRFIHPNGMTVVDGKIQLLINNLNADNGGTIEETIPSGIWEYDPKQPQKGLIHKESIAINKAADTISGYGQNRLPAVGALRNMNPVSTASGANGQVFVGSGYYTDATTTKYGVFYDDRNDTLQKSGYLVTTKVQAQGSDKGGALDNVWKSIRAFFRQMLTSTDKIMVKYRTVEVAPVEATITWTSTTTFTTTTNVSAYVGYEVEVLNGVGSGHCSTITSVTGSGTYTVTVEDTFTGASGTAKARFQYWKPVGTIQNQLYTHQSVPLGFTSSWVQFKVVMMFTGKDELEKLIVSNQVNKLIE